MPQRHAMQLRILEHPFLVYPVRSSFLDSRPVASARICHSTTRHGRHIHMPATHQPTFYSPFSSTERSSAIQVDSRFYLGSLQAARTIITFKAYTMRNDDRPRSRTTTQPATQQRKGDSPTLLNDHHHHYPQPKPEASRPQRFVRKASSIALSMPSCTSTSYQHESRVIDCMSI